MTERAEVSIVLTRSQLAQVARAASPTDRGITSLDSTFQDLRSASQLLGAAATSNVSHSVLRALLVLAAFPLDGPYRALADVARELDTNPSTTHRYVSTWLAVGLLEQDPKSRKYRRPGFSTDTSRAQGTRRARTPKGAKNPGRRP